jgi:hypothetical protein
MRVQFSTRHRWMCSSPGRRLAERQSDDRQWRDRIFPDQTEASALWQPPGTSRGGQCLPHSWRARQSCRPQFRSVDGAATAPTRAEARRTLQVQTARRLSRRPRIRRNANMQRRIRTRQQQRQRSKTAASGGVGCTAYATHDGRFQAWGRSVGCRTVASHVAPTAMPGANPWT